jgi:hypothetical protein
MNLTPIFCCADKQIKDIQVWLISYTIEAEWEQYKQNANRNTDETKNLKQNTSILKALRLWIHGGTTLKCLASQEYKNKYKSMCTYECGC